MVRVMVSSLHIIVDMLSFAKDTRSCLTDHDPHVNMSAVPAEDQPTNADDDQQDADEKGNELVTLHGEERLPLTTRHRSKFVRR